MRSYVTGKERRIEKNAKIIQSEYIKENIKLLVAL